MDLVPKILLLLICLGHIQEVRCYICAVGRERDEYKVWRWVLPYAYPCGCTRVIMGGMNTDTPRRHFRPVYVDKLLLSDHVGAIRTHYGLQCYEKAPNFEYCPADQSMSTDYLLSTAMATWHTPEAYDILGDMTGITCSNDSGSHFQIGETGVTCNATDKNGYTAMCNFTIAVKDREAPIFTNCPAIRASEPTLPETTSVVENPEAKDNSGQAPYVSCNKGAGYKFPVGKTEVICEARDESENKATCNVIVHIINPEEPAFTFCPETQTSTTLHGQSLGVVEWNDPLATDNSGDTPHVTCDVESGSNFTIGRTDVTCMASDASGNKATCNFPVSIIDIEQPSFSICPENQTTTTAHGQSISVIQWTHPIATDNSGDNPTVTCDVESGYNFAIGRTDVTCMASDASGNKATCSFTVNIIDPEEPAFSFCPEHIKRITALGQSSVHVIQWTHPIAMDNSGDTPTVTCNVESGFNFVIGQTDVTCTASDTSGNKATCSFTVTIQECKDGWLPFESECYFIGQEYLTWDQARTECQYKGGELATVNSQEKIDFLEGFTNNIYWIGLNDRANENSWVWAAEDEHGFIQSRTTTSDPAAQPEWGDHEPYGVQEHCVSMTEGGWKDFPCSSSIRYVCQKVCEFGGIAFGSECYWIGDNELSWDQARTQCWYKGGELATVNSREKKGLLDGLISEAYWIGLYNRGSENTWVWAAGDEALLGVDNNWATHPGSVDDGNKCVVMWTDGWTQTDCDGSFRYACQKECNNGWVAFDNVCYFNGASRMSWENAQKDCQQRGGHLATINTQLKQTFLGNWLYQANVYWIGLNDRDEENTWLWDAGDYPGLSWSEGTTGNIDGHPEPATAYNYWMTSEPDDSNATQNCVGLWPGRWHKWNDLPCDTNYRYICQKALTNTTQCERGWVAFKEEQMCYLKGTYKRSWEDARNDCQRREGHLATVNTDSKQTFLANWLIKEDMSWIGLNDKVEEDIWTWDAGDDPGFGWSGGPVKNGGSSTPPDAYHSWRKSQPNNKEPGQDCVVMLHLYGHDWNDLECSNEYRYVCQKAFTGAEINLIGQPTSQSSNSSSGLAERAVDGNSDGVYEGSHSCTHTGNDIIAWWRVDQKTSRCVGHVVLYNRVDSCCKERLLGATVRIGNDDNIMNNPECPMVVSTAQIDADQKIRVPCNLVGRYISVNLQMGVKPLTLCEVKAYHGVCVTDTR